MTVYKLIEVVGTSGTSIDDAVRGAIERASSTLEDLQWFEVKEIRGKVSKGAATEFQVKLDIGFLLHAPDNAGEKGSRRLGKELGSRQARSTAAQLVAKKGGRRRTDLARSFEDQRRK